MWNTSSMLCNLVLILCDTKTTVVPAQNVIKSPAQYCHICVEAKFTRLMFICIMNISMVFIMFKNIA